MRRALPLLLVLLAAGCPDPAPAQRGSTAPAARGGDAGAFARPDAQEAARPAPQPTPRAQVLPGLGPPATSDDLPHPGPLADLPAGEMATGQLEAADDVDCFRVRAQAGETVRIAAQCYGEVALTLRARDGRSVQGLGTIELTAPRGEDYVLEVRPNAGQGLFYALQRD